MISTKFWSRYYNLISERGKSLYYSKNWQKIFGPKVSVIERFHCIHGSYMHTSIFAEAAQLSTLDPLALTEDYMGYRQ